MFKVSNKEIGEKEKGIDLGFKMNGIVKNAREANMMPNSSNVNLKVLNMNNRAQLTPLIMDNFDKVKSEMVFDSMNTN